MTTYPADSEDARELRERDVEMTLHNPKCADGWLGEDDHGRPVPCEHCRPHLYRRCTGCAATAQTCGSKATLSGRRCCLACRHGEAP